MLGSVNADLVVVADRLPAAGETVAGGSFSRHWGGKGANQSVAASRYGADVVLVAAVGEDDLGAGALESLQADGVRTDWVAVLPDVPTGVALIVVDRQGQNQIAVASGANRSVKADGLEVLLGEGAAGVLLACFEIPDEPILQALRIARRLEWQVVVNPAPARRLPEAFRGSRVILTPNQGELEALTGVADTPTAARLLVDDVTGAPLVVTLAEQGALVVTKDQAVPIEAPQVEARDTTGAGDAFNGVFAAALAEGRSLMQAARRAVWAGTLSVQAEGAREGMVTRSTLEDRMGRLP